jgi:putative transposase
VTGANRHDVSQLAAVLEARVMHPPKSKRSPFLFADKGYDGKPARVTIVAHGYAPRVCPKKRKRGQPFKNRRWVVEVAHLWYNRFRKLLVHFEKYSSSYEALLHLASAVICWRKVASIYG